MENTITVYCDAKGCGWKKLENVEALAQWHNATCPSCGHAPVLNDDDIALVAMLIGLRDMGMVAIGEGAKLNKPSIDMLINTAGLRQEATDER
jgi:hypothetical protein